MSFVNFDQQAIFELLDGKYIKIWTTKLYFFYELKSFWDKACCLCFCFRLSIGLNRDMEFNRITVVKYVSSNQMDV